ncbi:MAG: NAD(P)H-hydrate dehydratase [Acidobacteriota bacterium]
MRVLSAAEMQACDRATTERFGIPSIQLMRNAAAAVAACAREWFPDAKRITVLCGRGNNGGDGMMAARLLAEAGCGVTVVLLGSPVGLKDDAARAWRELKDAGSCHIAVAESESDLARHNEVLGCDLIVDAVVGTGFKPPLKGLALAALDWVKGSAAPVLAVDLPSGWPADSTSAHCDDPAFRADAVVTFTAPKPAHVFGELTRFWHQPVVVAPIGSPEEAVVSELGLRWAGSAMELAQQPRAAESNKGDFGHVLVVGGSFGSAGGKAGAPAMTSMAAMRAGAGLVTAAVPAPALPVVAGIAPELMTQPLAVNDAGEILPVNASPLTLPALLKGITVLAVGPGMGQGPAAQQFFAVLLNASQQPVVIDADGLNILSHLREMLPQLARNGRTVVLTPHPGEMARLAGISTKEVQANRLEVAREFATRHEVHVVLKGARTLIAHPDGSVAVNTSGNPGMAKGGSGDVLTGIVAGMLAQFPQDAARAVEAAVCLHGLAADLTVRRMDEHTMLATDTLAEFSAAFRYRSTDKNGYVWLQGLHAQ